MIGVVDLFFKRKKRERGEYPDVYQYQNLPQEFRNQVFHIWNEAIGQDFESDWNTTPNRLLLQDCYKILCKELGVLYLKDEYFDSYFIEIVNYFLKANTEVALSIIELMQLTIEAYTKNNHTFYQGVYDQITSEINQRFKENGVGYQLEDNKIIQIDSQYIHAETIKPTLAVLNQKIYQGAQEEFLKAHEHYRHQRYQETMVECLKAYESTIKIIMKKRGWEYNTNDTADALTGKLLQKGLVPNYLLQYFKSLKNTLTAGTPTVRNNEAGHGQGNELKEIPDYLVSYVLHITASAILFLVRAEEALPT